jgi:hypothetical protein
MPSPTAKGVRRPLTEKCLPAETHRVRLLSKWLYLGNARCRSVATATSVAVLRAGVTALRVQSAYWIPGPNSCLKARPNSGIGFGRGGKVVPARSGQEGIKGSVLGPYVEIGVEDHVICRVGDEFVHLLYEVK